MDYPDYQPTGGGGGNYISLKQSLQSEGDTLKLTLVSAEIVDASDSQFGCTRLKMTVSMTERGKKVDKILECDAPDEKNEFQGSQIYRGIKDNNIQEGDVFEIQHGGNMNNQYRTKIYKVMKVHVDSDDAASDNMDRMREAKEDVQIEDIEV